MRALVYHQFKKPPSVEDVSDPNPSKQGVVVKVKATGICRSDWHGWMGHDPDIVLPHIPGHELAGEIVDCGYQVQRFKVGDRVTIPFVAGCGSCVYCRQGDPQVCNTQFQPGFTAWGSFAEYVALEYADFNLVHLPSAINFESAAALGCRFATSFRALAHQGKVRPGQFVVIFGCGGVGLSAIMIAKAMGAMVIAVDLKEEPLKLAQHLGADYVSNFDHPQSIAQILDWTEGGCHITIDALGSPAIVAQCFAVLRKRGKHIQVGLMPPQSTDVTIPMDRVIADELELLGSHGMQAVAYQQMFALIASGKIDPGKLIQKRLKLSEAGKALVTMNQYAVAGIQLITDFQS